MPSKFRDAHQPTAEEVRDVIADREHRYLGSLQSDDLYPVGKYDIVEAILGEDPSWGHYRGGGFGPSRDTFINPKLSMTTLTSVLDQLTDEGVLKKVKAPTYSNRREPEMQEMGRAVRFTRSKAGWVLAESFNDALAKADARQRDARRSKLRKDAEQEIVAKYAKQVTAAYNKLCADEGLEPAYEAPDPKDLEEF